MKAKFAILSGLIFSLLVVAFVAIYMLWKTSESDRFRTRFDKKLEIASGTITAKLIFSASRLSRNGIELSSAGFRSTYSYDVNEKPIVEISQEWVCEFSQPFENSEKQIESIERHFLDAFEAERQAISFEIKGFEWNQNQLRVKYVWIAKNFGEAPAAIFSIDKNYKIQNITTGESL